MQVAFEETMSLKLCQITVCDDSNKIRAMSQQNKNKVTAPGNGPTSRLQG